ncbi:hypothetical protein C0Q70_11555 [Pomacea canaliculata]|uniref:Uncharacterized protein n=1 Tax=Pomacea canaliculata TaxID=400727 RepID=A0A2T7P6B6_POMCA|nr:hypothetical protein C0Q70_11555 [Pomacea canaliculata]
MLRESKMPRVMLPLLQGTNDSEYELVARIYDPWNDFVEVSQPINLYVDESSSSLEKTLLFWDGQSSYTNWSSNLEKQMKSLTIASSLIAAHQNIKQVVNAGWNDVWTELQHPSSTPIRDNLTAVRLLSMLALNNI